MRVATNSLYQPGKAPSLRSGFSKAAKPMAKAGVWATVLNMLGTTPRCCSKASYKNGELGRDLVPLEHGMRPWASSVRHVKRRTFPTAGSDRGVPFVLVIVPNPSPLKMLFGLAKIGWFQMLKKSAANLKFLFSVMRNFCRWKHPSSAGTARGKYCGRGCRSRLFHQLRSPEHRLIAFGSKN